MAYDSSLRFSIAGTAHDEVWWPSISPPEWTKRALCAEIDPDLFYPAKNNGMGTAKRMCLGCPVRGECLQFALDNDERHGVWGGKTPPERRKLQRAQAMPEAS